MTLTEGLAALLLDADRDLSGQSVNRGYFRILIATKERSCLRVKRPALFRLLESVVASPCAITQANQRAVPTPPNFSLVQDFLHLVLPPFPLGCLIWSFQYSCAEDAFSFQCIIFTSMKSNSRHGRMRPVSPRLVFMYIICPASPEI